MSEIPGRNPERRDIEPATMDDKNALLEVTMRLTEDQPTSPVVRKQFVTQDNKNISLARFLQKGPNGEAWTCAIREIVAGQVAGCKYFLYNKPEENYPLERYEEATSQEQAIYAIERVADIDSADELFKVSNGLEGIEEATHAATKALMNPAVSHIEAVELYGLLANLE